MFERFTERARQVVVLAQEEARILKHNYIGTEHILLGLVRENEGVAARILLDFDADPRIRNEGIRTLRGPASGSPSPCEDGRMALIRSACVVALCMLALPCAAGARVEGTEDVLLVGNNWDGTADVVEPRGFERLTRINIVADLAERRAEIARDPVALALFLAIRQLIGEGHDQLVDDMFTSPDGRRLYVSRPSLADVVALDLRTRRIVWRTEVDGYRADHMAISPDGSRLLVSASTARKVQAIDTATGRVVGEFESGDQPHENNFSRDGSLIYHASIGSVYTPLDEPALDATKGDRYFQVVDARTLRILKRIDVGRSPMPAFPG